MNLLRRRIVLAAPLAGPVVLSLRDNGPLFAMYPFDARPHLHNAVHFSRCIRQLRSIELV